MGVNLLLLDKERKTLACLGRAHNYETDNTVPYTYEEVCDLGDEMKNYYLSKVLSAVSYAPKNIEEATDMALEIEALLEELEDHLRKMGRQEVIASLIEEGLYFKKE